jgi:hypothetical protein
MEKLASAINEYEDNDAKAILGKAAAKPSF